MGDFGEVFSIIIIVFLGYVSGSILTAYFIPKWIFHIDTIQESDDGNPGTANAFKCVGKLCGSTVLLLELLKGFIPVFIGSHIATISSVYMILILLAPIMGHAFSCFNRFKGGKAIAVTFGALLGLLPEWRPAVILAIIYVFFSVVVKISPHKRRSIVTFVSWFVVNTIWLRNIYFTIASLLIAFIVVYKHLCDKQEHKEIIKEFEKI